MENAKEQLGAAKIKLTDAEFKVVGYEKEVAYYQKQVARLRGEEAAPVKPSKAGTPMELGNQGSNQAVSQRISSNGDSEQEGDVPD